MTPRPGKFFTHSLVPDNSPPEESEDALALEFSARYAQTLRFDAERGRWYRWNGKSWEADTTGNVLEAVRTLCRAKSAVCIDERIACRIASAATAKAVERLARVDRRHASTSVLWDADPWLLNTPTGVVDLRTGKIRPSAQEDYMTKMTTVTLSSLWHAFISSWIWN